MKYREFKRAITDFGYELTEYDVFPSGVPKKRLVEVSIAETNIRAKNPMAHYEVLMKGRWQVVSKANFQHGCLKTNLNVVKTKKSSGATKVSNTLIKLSLVDRLKLSAHATQRLEERFQLGPGQTKNFLEKTLKDHFVLQNYDNGIHRQQDASYDAMLVCSRDFKVVLVVAPQQDRFVVITAYDPNTSGYTNVTDWFNQNMDHVHEMPRLEDYYAA